MRTAPVLSLSLALVCGGCATMTMQPLRGPENSMCQELLAESTQRQVTMFDLAQFRGRKVHLEVASAVEEKGVVTSRYVEQLLAKELHRVGAVLVEERAEADLSLVCIVHAAGLQLGSTTFPPGWLFYLLPLSYTREITGRFSADLFWLRKGRPGELATQQPPPQETTYRELYVFGLGPFRGSR
ncbi:MAG: hypothetical protein ACLF0G_03835 [Candidatus Brocadiia bacterium]